MASRCSAIARASLVSAALGYRVSSRQLPHHGRLPSRLVFSFNRGRIEYPNASMYPFHCHNRHIAVKKNTHDEVKLETCRQSSDETNDVCQATDPPSLVLSTTSLSSSSSSLSSVTQPPSGWRKRLQRRAGAILSTVGFVSSATRALLRDERQQWRPTVQALSNFLQTSGLDRELTTALLNVRLLDNLVILSRVEKHGLLEFRSSCATTSDDVSTVTLPTSEEALRYMKYATAVYGNTMIRAAEMDVLGKFDSRLSPVTRTRISEHCAIPVEDIVLMDIDYGGDNNHLRHFVAVDHKHQNIVLAIRGTFSLSELVVDVAGFTRPFAAGEAHSEMATMAERVWDVAGSTVLALLDEHPGYELILTGHSLGAGTASLLNILCHANERALVRGHSVRCFSFAAPPTFGPLEAAPEAVRACTSYIHGRDVVPFLSVDAIRHLCLCINAVEGQGLTWTERIQLMIGYSQPSAALLETVVAANANRLEPKEGAPVLFIPAAANVWMQEIESTDNYDVRICDSSRLAHLGILIDSNMLEHHLPSRYEHALHKLSGSLF